MHPVPQVELFEFKGEDLTDEEDGGIIRRIRARGEGHAKPNDGALVEGEAGQGGFRSVLVCTPRVACPRSTLLCEARG